MEKVGIGGNELSNSKMPVRIEKTSSTTTYSALSTSIRSSSTSVRKTRSSIMSSKIPINSNSQIGNHRSVSAAIEMQRGSETGSADWELIHKEADVAGSISSGDEDITADDGDALTTITDSYLSARTNTTRVSTISGASQKGIKILSNVYQSAANAMTVNNNNHGTSSEVLYPTPARSTRSSSVQKARTALAEEFRSISRASAQTHATTRYDSDDDEDYDETIVEEETRTILFYNRVSKILRFGWRVLINVIGVPIYWLLVQFFVLEKWILYRSPPVTTRNGTERRNLAKDGTYNGVPYHDCRPSSRANTITFAVPSRRNQSWAREVCWLLWIIFGLLLLGAVLAGLVKTGIIEMISTTTASIISYIFNRSATPLAVTNIISDSVPPSLSVQDAAFLSQDGRTGAPVIYVPVPTPSVVALDSKFEDLKRSSSEDRRLLHELHLQHEIDELKNRLRIVENSLTTAHYGMSEFKNRITKLEGALEVSRLDTNSINKILDQVMDVHLGEILGRTVTLKNLALVVNEATSTQNDGRDLEKQERILRNVQESLEAFRQEMNQKYYSPPVPTLVKETISQPPPLSIDIEAVKEDLTKYLITTIRQECNDCASMMTTIEGNQDVLKIVKMAIAKYDADKTGVADLALEPAGGSIVSTRCTKSSVKRSSVYTFFGLPFWHPPNNPRTIIQPGAVPGECWSYEGSEGFVVIQLVAPSIVTGFTLEHIPKELSPFGHIKSAPKNFEVVGLIDYNNPETEFVFGSYTYEDNGEPIQYFPVQFESNKVYPFVELKIRSNHGSIEFTCVYRFRVHGHITDSKSNFSTVSKEQINFLDPV